MNKSNSLTVPIEYENEVDAILSENKIEVKDRSYLANSAQWPNSDDKEDSKTIKYVLYQITISSTLAFWIMWELTNIRNRKLLPSPK